MIRVLVPFAEVGNVLCPEKNGSKAFGAVLIFPESYRGRLVFHCIDLGSSLYNAITTLTVSIPQTHHISKGLS